MVAVSNLIPSKSIQVQSPCELTVVNLTLNPNTFICCAYVPPSSPTSYLENIAQVLHTLPSSSSHLILLGDFNIIDVNWSTLHSLSPSLSSFCDHLVSFNMQQIMNASTHIQGNTLDLVFSNQPNLFSNLTVSPTYSEHHLISLHLLNSSIPSNPTTTRFVWNYSKADLEGLQHYLFDSNLHTCLQSKNVNDIGSVIKQHISDVCQLFVPRVKVPKSPSPKWFHSENVEKKSLTLRRQYNQTPTLHTLNKLNQTELLLQNLIISSKKDYEHQLVSSYYSNPGTCKLFDHLKSLTDSTSSNYPILEQLEASNNCSTKSPDVQ